jgi:hypothetical protein
MTDTFLLVGFGNPGREYINTRHNIGFMLIDRLAVRLNAHGMKLQSKAIVMSALYEERKVILAKPQTYMNLSGQSVQGLLHFYKLPPENLLVAHDDLDLLARFGFVPLVAPAVNVEWPPLLSNLEQKSFHVCVLASVVRLGAWTRRIMFFRISQRMT